MQRPQPLGQVHRNYLLDTREVPADHIQGADLRGGGGPQAPVLPVLDHNAHGLCGLIHQPTSQVIAFTSSTAQLAPSPSSWSRPVTSTGPYPKSHTRW